MKGDQCFEWGVRMKTMLPMYEIQIKHTKIFLIQYCCPKHVSKVGTPLLICPFFLVLRDARIRKQVLYHGIGA
jgi:hypothetical protein